MSFYLLSQYLNILIYEKILYYYNNFTDCNER